MSNRDSTSRRGDDPRFARAADGSSLQSGERAQPGERARPGDTAPPGPILPSDEMPTVISSDIPVAPSIFDRAIHPRELGRLLEGERLGYFELEKFVGGGGMGAVFQATDTMLGRTVAVKVLSHDQASEEDTLLRFKNEAQSAARLDHENIARVYYVGEDRGLNYIVFEFIEGENIRDLVDRRGGLPLGEAISYTLQIAEALDHACQRDVVHRDIKPSNVLITAEGHAKLVDMGLARLHQVEHSGDDLTASGVTLGTFDYISPEQARDPRTADVRSDLYSLGCTLYFMLTGKPPFPDGTVLQKLLQHQGDEPPDPREVRSDLPQEMTRLLSKMLFKSPEARYQQPSELIADLLLLADRLGIRHVVKPGKVWVAEPRSRWAMLRQHAPWMVPVATLLAVVLLMDYLGSPSPLASTPMDDMPVVREQSDEGTDLAPTRPKDTAPPEDSSNGKVPTGDRADPTPPDKDPLPTTTPLPPDDASDVPPESVASSIGTLRESITPSKAPGTSLDVSDDGGTSAELDVAAADAAALAETENTAAVDLSDGVPSAVVPGQRTLIVDGSGGPSGRYATLGAAINEAKSGDTIELHYDRPNKVEQPIVFDEKELTIRAGIDRQRDSKPFQPVILFRPTQDDDVTHKRLAMITLRGGDVTFEGIHVQMDLAKNVTADYWSMFEIHGTTHLQLSGCSLTIRNTQDTAQYHKKVSFIDVRESPNGESMTPDGMDMSKRPVTIDLARCVVRGEAVFLSAPELQPLNLTWIQGLLATTEQLLVAGSGSTQGESRAGIQIDLQHVTALTQEGVFHSTNKRDAPYQLVSEFFASHCIFIGDKTNPPHLIKQSGVGLAASPDDLGEGPSADKGAIRNFTMRVIWSREQSKNIFQDFDFISFWSIHSGDEELDRRTFIRWGEDHLPMISVRPPTSIWKSTPPDSLVVHLLTAADFLIDEKIKGNPAFVPGKERQCGFFPSELPQLPPIVTLDDVEATRPDQSPAGDEAAPKPSNSTSGD
ncbi:MAG: serine/threonine protein kinase [Planctomycetes bacterium]|nr:serine/threonine protein kinase [Planctomycetota bacterium]